MDTDVSFLAVMRDGIANAVFLGYSGLPGAAFLLKWQQPVEQSFVVPLWTLSIEFYGSIIVLVLCWCARRSRVLWWTVVLLGAAFTVRSAYICFFVGHLLASFERAGRPAPASKLLPIFALLSGVFTCVFADVWQPQWLRVLCADPTYLLFPGQFAPMQQKAAGAMLVLIGLIELQAARDFLSRPWLVAVSRFSFPIYLIHWPVLLGPTAALFLLLNGVVGPELARLGAIVAGIGLSFAASTFFLPVDRCALELSRRCRKRISASTEQPLPVASIVAAE
jgi:peptidoglycan/LPS O-acetylase OafA/YrhL